MIVRVRVSAVHEWKGVGGVVHDGLGFGSYMRGLLWGVFVHDGAEFGPSKEMNAALWR